jgi:cell division protease FtsH
LGITASLPEEDRHSYTKDWLEGQLTMLFGGRVAEEMVFGPEKITTGAGNDIERATAMARRMVTRFGMSDVIGLMAVGDSDQEVFLGRELVQRREYSEHTAQQVDQEVKRILDEAYDRAREVLETNRALLESLSGALLVRETLDRHEVEALARGETLPPLEMGESDAEPVLAKPQGRGRIGGGGGESGGSRGPGRSIEGETAIDSGERSPSTQGEEAQHPPRVESPTRVARSES